MTGPQAPRLPIWQGTGGWKEAVPQKCPNQMVAPMRRQRWDGARVTTSSRPSLDKSSGDQQDTVLHLSWAPSSPTYQGLHELEAMRRRPGSTSDLSLLLLMITAPLTTDLMEPLTVDNRQLLTWERSPLPCGPMAEQDY